MPASKGSKHKVDITVTIEMATVAVEERSEGDGQRKRRRSPSVETSKPQHYFHSEYRLLPGDSEIVKSDVVTFGRNAKVYTETDSKILRTWKEGGLVYFAWSQSRKVEVSKDLLLALFDHIVELRIWDSKDKVSPRARFDRPKGFKANQLPSREPSMEVTHNDMLDPDLTATSLPQSSGKLKDTKTKPSKTVGPHEDYILAPVSPSSLQASLFESDKHGALLGDQLFTPDTDVLDTEASRKETRKSPRKQQSRRADQSDLSKQPIAVLMLPMSQLFFGRSEISLQLQYPSARLQNAKIMVSVGGSLMSEKQRLDLNPMSITLRGVTRMPEQPIGYNELRQRCLPAYCSYKFFKQCEYRSSNRGQNKNILWEDTSVVLLGMLDRDLLVEWLCGPPFVVEVHDRDRKFEDMKGEPAEFGKLKYDEDISSIKLMQDRKTTHNPFKGPLKPWDPFGIAKFNLSELLHGVCLLSLSSPILNCPRPNSTNDRLLVDMYSDNPNGGPMPPGRYIESGSELKLKIRVIHPLISPHTEPKITKTVTDMATQCPYARIIYIFPCQDTSFLNRLVSEVTSINAAALGFADLERHVMELALSTYKLSSGQQHNKQLDIITGFQVEDGNYHIFVLEGLAKQGIQTIWTTVHYPTTSGTGKALYSSDMTFSERLYTGLDVDLCHVRLHEPISQIIGHPLVYVQDMIPKLCYDALMTLDKIAQSTRLADVSRNGQFPTSDMILALNEEFGVQVLKTADSQQKADELSSKSVGQDKTDVKKPGNIKTSRIWTPIDNENESYHKALAERSEHPPSDYIKLNIMRTGPSKRASRRRHVRSVSEDTGIAAHNYSIQTLNSTVQAKNRLRNALENGRLYTYCHDYHSMTLVPEDLEQVRKEEEHHQKKLWQTTHGFVYPGLRTSLESNRHAIQLDEARQEELKQPWEENILHANKLKPTVDRMRFSWPQRRKDMDLWQKPPPFFGCPAPISLDQDRDSATTEDKQLLPFKTHRLSTQTENTMEGPHSSNQLEKLKGLLKDKPNRKWMKRSSVPDVPPLSVVGGDGEIREKEGKGGFHPGPLDGHSWCIERNKIPITARQSDKFAEKNRKEFRLYLPTHSPLSKRPIAQLTKEERENHLFYGHPAGETVEHTS